MPISGHVKVRTEYVKATLGLVKRLEINKELIRECVTVPGCCCMPLLHNHSMDSCSYVHKNTFLATKGWYICNPPFPPKSATVCWGWFWVWDGDYNVDFVWLVKFVFQTWELVV